MELCVTTGFYRRYPDGSARPFSERIKFIKETGFTEIDFGLNESDLLEENAEKTFAAKADMAAAAGLKIRYSHLPFVYPKDDDAEAWERFRKASMIGIKVSKSFGVDCTVIHPGSVRRRDYDHDAERKYAVEFLTPYCDEAAKVGLDLVFENMRGPGLSGPWEIRRFCTETNDLISLADEFGCGICWDTGHGNISGQYQYNSIMKIGKRLRELHINDNFAEDDVHIAPFLGTVPWDEVARALHDVGFKGSLNLELECTKRPVPLQKAYADYVIASARLLRDMIQTAGK